VKVSVSKPTETTRELSIEVSPELVEKAIEQETDRVRKKVQIPGFRKGKAPRGMIVSQYGQQINATAIENALNDYYRLAVDEEKLYPIGPADISDMDYKPGQSLKFVAKIEIEPEFEIGELKGIRVEKEVPEVKPEMVEETLKKIQYKFGKLVNKEGPAENGDQLLVDIEEIDPATGVSLIGKSYSDQALLLGDNPYGKEFNDQLIGVQIDDEKRIVQQMEQGIIQSPGQQENQHPPEVHLKVKVKKVESVQLPEANDEFAKELKFDDLKSMKKGITSDLLNQLQSAATEKLRASLEQEVIRIIDPPVPNSMVERYLDVLEENFKKQPNAPQDTGKIREEGKEIARKKVQWFLIKQKLITQEKIELTDTDLDDYLTQYSKDSGIDIKRLKIEYKSGKKREDLKNVLLDKKFYDFLESKAEVKTIS